MNTPLAGHLLRVISTLGIDCLSAHTTGVLMQMAGLRWHLRVSHDSEVTVTENVKAVKVQALSPGGHLKKRSRRDQEKFLGRLLSPRGFDL